MKLDEIYIGQEFTNSLGEHYTVVGKTFGINNLDKQNIEFIVLFSETNNYQIVYYSFIGSNHVHDCSKPYIYGIGYVKGSKDNPARIGSSSDMAYRVWYNMLTRCYKNGGHGSYKNVVVCKEWHNYNNFREWYNSVVPKDVKQELHLDKDLFSEKGNKVYSPNTCCILPKEINVSITCLNKFSVDDVTETSAKSIYKLSLLIDRFDYLLQDKVKKKLRSIVNTYNKKYKRMVGRCVSTDFKDFQLEKADLSKIKITSFLKLDYKVYEFNNMKELKEFIMQIERKEDLKIKPSLVTVKQSQMPQMLP